MYEQGERETEGQKEIFIYLRILDVMSEHHRLNEIHTVMTSCGTMLGHLQSYAPCLLVLASRAK